MTLDEMEHNLQTEEARLAARKTMMVCLNDKQDQVGRSFYCINSHHGDCKWAECKCNCHKIEWCGM